MSDTSDLIITNVNPVTLCTTIDAQGQLQISYGTTSLRDHGDAITVRLDSTPEGGALAAKIRILDPDPRVELQAVHEDDAGQPITWSRARDPGECVHTWSETSREFAVVVSPRTAEAKPKTVYIKVRPVEDLPDRA